MTSSSERIARWLVSARWPLLAIAAVLFAVAWPASQRLSFDRSIENMFAADDPLLAPYRRLKSEFGGNELLLAVYRDPGLLESDGQGLARQRELAESLKQVEGVRDVLSLAEIDRAMRLAIRMKRTKDNLADRVWGLFGGGRQRERADDGSSWTLVDPDDPLAEAFRELFAGYTHDSSGRIAAVVCMLQPQAESQVPRERTVAEVRRLVESQVDGMVTGEPAMVVDGFRYLEEDGQRLGWVSLALLSLTIVICFRSLRWVIIPVAVVQWSLIVTQALLVWSGLRLSMVSSMFTATITVVGVATVVHVIVRFRQARGRGLEPRAAMVDSLSLLIAPIGWACLTDAVGFASLLVARVGPVRDFGIMMATGALMVLLGTALLVPGLALLGRFDTDPHRAWGERQLAGMLERLIRWVDQRPWTLAGALTGLLVLSVLGLGRLQVETDFTKNFRQDSPIVQSYDFVERNLGGAGVWDVILPAPARLDEAYLERVSRLEERLRALRLEERPPAGQRAHAAGQTGLPADERGPAADEPGLTADEPGPTADEPGPTADGTGLTADGTGLTADEPGPTADGTGPPADEMGLTKVISLADAVRVVEVEPSLAREPVGQRILGMALSMPDFIGSLRSKPDDQGRAYLRVMLRARERQPAERKLQLIGEVERIVREEFPATEDREGGQVTGFFVLLAHLVHSMLRDQWVCFAVATAGIALMMLVAFRSPTLALVALVPNALPIFVVLGGLGWLNLKINMGAAMIAAVSIGLSVDSSIHYILSFRRERAAGKSLYVALADVQQTVGRAMVFSTLALIVGFTVLCTSNFVPTIYFGALVSISMLGGLLGNLFVLPLLLRLVTPSGGHEAMELQAT